MKVSARVLLSIVLVLTMVSLAQAGDVATPQEVVAKVREAAAFVGQSGDAGIDEFRNKDGRWVWGGTYVWVQKCGDNNASPIILAHPIKPGLCGKDLSGLKDKNGTYFFIEFCEACQKPEGGWVEYWWPKPGETEASRKISYILKVPGTEYEVGAGIYDDDITLDQLNEMLK